MPENGSAHPMPVEVAQLYDRLVADSHALHVQQEAYIAREKRRSTIVFYGMVTMITLTVLYLVVGLVVQVRTLLGG